MTEPIIRTVDLHKDFGSIHVLRGISAEEAAAFLCENFTEERFAMSVVRPLE